MDNAIHDFEVRAMRGQKIAKIDIGKKNFKQEAKYYLEETDYDYYKALENYKADLEIEIELFTKEKEAKKSNKKGKGKKSA